MATRILVIDDSEVILAGVRRVLEGDGHEVVTTTQTIGAARHIRNCDLCIIDFHMPGFDGAEVMRSLRAATAGATKGAMPGTEVAPTKPCAFYLFTSDESVARDYARYGFDGAIAEKGNDVLLVRQVRAALRMQQVQAVRRRAKPAP